MQAPSDKCTISKGASPNREYKVADISQADFGRMEYDIAEVEMPGLMACRKEFGPAQPFKGVQISGSLHMTIQTGKMGRYIHFTREIQGS